jgi:hypothetical protein
LQIYPSPVNPNLQIHCDWALIPLFVQAALSPQDFCVFVKVLLLHEKVVVQSFEIYDRPF